MWCWQKLLDCSIHKFLFQKDIKKIFERKKTQDFAKTLFLAFEGPRKVFPAKQSYVFEENETIKQDFLSYDAVEWIPSEPTVDRQTKNLASPSSSHLTIY